MVTDNVYRQTRERFKRLQGWQGAIAQVREAAGGHEVLGFQYGQEGFWCLAGGLAK